MFIWTARLRRGKLALGAAAVLLLCGAAVVVGGFLTRGVDAASTGPASPKGIKTNEDRVAYLESYGWQVSPEPVSVEELLIPEEFDETYDQYLALQSGQGFDLTKYRGKRVKRYTYEVTNYPTGETGIQAGLLIYKNTVIGGEVLSSDLGGFIQGLAQLSAKNAAASHAGWGLRRFSALRIFSRLLAAHPSPQPFSGGITWMFRWL